MTTTTERMLPLYEAKMLKQFDHRDADVVKSLTAAKRQNQPRYLTASEHLDPKRTPIPSVWVSGEFMPNLDTGWFSGFSDVTSSTNERTVLASALPAYPVGHTYPLVFSKNRPLLLAVFNCFAFDYVARQKVAGLHLTYSYVKQLPMPSPKAFDSLAAWDRRIFTSQFVIDRVLELIYTSWEIEPFARENGDIGFPFRWDDGRRTVLRTELDAAFFHLYGLVRDDVDHIMDTFPIVKRKDEAAFGEFKTKRLILEAYDAMQMAIDTGIPFESTLNPLPGQGPRHPAKETVA